jgi:hypothetical protein
MTNRKFSPGDTVRCVDSTAWAEHFTEGLLYRVERYERFVPRRGWLILFESDDNGRPYTAFEDRFTKEK